MRIIAGLAKGRLFKTVPGLDVRPTADRVRESIFNILGPRMEGSRVLDLFAGSGALGLESLSRGASSAIFIEKSKRAARVIEKNIVDLGFESARVMTLDVFRSMSILSKKEERFDFVFADPPYRLFDESWIFEVWKVVQSLLEREGIFILEHPSRWTPPQKVGNLVLKDSRKYGQTQISFFTHF
ncbi:MAG: 16S rRNA (guanine(966)-N(2))-methyltransferase RsmD [Chlamydiae bacterium]|nr:16S rRNA (guanine(966)-N(2))-methyltransferase RsmD [Chlamydiota bacterium]MBI3266736.1 16S rRNA (guanine(966)-N(2))-methyltransferase RsmD [Chlamydiota bacterium]